MMIAQQVRQCIQFLGECRHLFGPNGLQKRVVVSQVFHAFAKLVQVDGGTILAGSDSCLTRGSIALLQAWTNSTPASMLHAKPGSAGPFLFQEPTHFAPAIFMIETPHFLATLLFQKRLDFWKSHRTGLRRCFPKAVLEGRSFDVCLSCRPKISCRSYCSRLSRG